MTLARTVRLAAVFAVALCLAAAAAAVQDDRIAKRLAEFEREDDPVDKARRLPKLGEAQLDLVADKVQKGEIEEAFNLLEAYRDWVRTAHAGLKESGINAEKKPNGFKHIQIHLRRSIRQLDHTITRIPVEYRPWFQAVRVELEKINRELLQMLFPRRPGR